MTGSLNTEKSSRRLIGGRLTTMTDTSRKASTASSRGIRLTSMAAGSIRQLRATSMKPKNARKTAWRVSGASGREGLPGRLVAGVAFMGGGVFRAEGACVQHDSNQSAREA